MAGHSKWKNIKRKKEANDKVKGAAFAKLSRIITLAVVEGGNIPDPEHNFKLRLAIDKARSLNMPKENIARAIEKAKGADKNLIREIMYEGFAPYGVAMLVHTTSDNANRTVSEVKNLIEMHGGKMGGQGSVSYLFQKCGLVEFEAQENTEDRVMAFAEAMNAFDIDRVGDTYYVYVPFDSFGRIKDSLEGMKAKSTEIDYRPTTTVMIEDDKNARRILAIIEALEELDDVQRVFSNLEVPDSFDVTA